MLKYLVTICAVLVIIIAAQGHLTITSARDILQTRISNIIKYSDKQIAQTANVKSSDMPIPEQKSNTTVATLLSSNTPNTESTEQNPSKSSIPEISRTVAPKSMKGIYLTAATMAGKNSNAITDKLVAVGGNTVVMDVLFGGKLAYPSQIPLSQELENTSKIIPDMTEVVRKLHEKNIYVVGRFVLFKNSYLANRKKEWTLKDKKNGRPYSNREGAIWLDSSNPELLSYYADVCKELAKFGFDEIQFDYVRFPEGGKNGYSSFTYTTAETRNHEQAIEDAVAKLAAVLHSNGVNVGVDVFGIIVWDKVSGPIIGQNPTALASLVDSIYPMAYPSHFGPGWGGHKNPGDEPYFFNYETNKRFIEKTAGTGVSIRPWLQGFSYRSSNFGVNYIRDEISAINDLKLEQYISWNAANNYQYTFGAYEATAVK